MVYVVNLLLFATALVFLWVNYDLGRVLDHGGPNMDAAMARRVKRNRRAFNAAIMGQVLSLSLIVVHVMWTSVMDGGMQASLVCLGLALVLAGIAAWAVWTGLVM